MFGHQSVDSVTWALGWALMQFLWQGAMIGVIAAIVLGQMRDGSAQVRYAVACSALVCCGIAFVGTSVWALMPVESVGGAVGRVGMLGEYNSRSGLMLESVAWLWVGGVVFFALRFAMQWRNARRLRFDQVSSVDEVWQGVFEMLKEEMGVSSAVRLMRSGLAEVPMVVGWVSPMVLIPVSAFTSLTRDQLRAVIAHELEHIRRYDHLVNAAQVVIETVLFFHPVVWWLSQQARVEREHCCDDAAVVAAGDRIIFAQALTRLESMRGTQSRAVLALNQGGSLMNRITRLLGTTESRKVGRKSIPIWAALTTGMLVAGAGIANAALRVEPSKEKIGQIRTSVELGEISFEDSDTKHTDLKAGIVVYGELVPNMSDSSTVVDGVVIDVVNETVGESGEISIEEGNEEDLRKKLNPSDEDYWLHQGIRPMSAYEDELDC